MLVHMCNGHGVVAVCEPQEVSVQQYNGDGPFKLKYYLIFTGAIRPLFKDHPPPPPPPPRPGFIGGSAAAPLLGRYTPGQV